MQDETRSQLKTVTETVVVMATTVNTTAEAVASMTKTLAELSEGQKIIEGDLRGLHKRIERLEDRANRFPAA